MEALYALSKRKTPSIVLCPLASLLQKVVAKEELSPLLGRWSVGDKKAFDQLPEQLTALGYARASVVSDKGEFAIRGGIVDLFPVSSSDPFRLDFFGNEIDAIRTFDPVGQKSIGKTDGFFLSPAKELPLLQQAKKLACIADYFPSAPLFFWDDLLAIEDNHVALQSMPGSNSPFFFSLEHLLKRFRSEQHLFCIGQKLEEFSARVVNTRERTRALQGVSFDALGTKFDALRFFHPFQRVADAMDLDTFEPEDPKLEIMLLCQTTSEERELRSKAGPTPPCVRATLTSGIVITDIPLALIPISEITHKTTLRRQKWRSTYHTATSEFHALTPGEPVVHFHSGIGRYLGMEKQVNHLGVETEFLKIEYADKANLFVPLSQSYLLSRYIGSSDELPSLSQLGSKRWQTTRQNAQAQIVGYANDLLKHYAERAAHGGFSYPTDSTELSEFETAFPYHETQDQLLAIAAIKEDMMSAKAMDRLICGDVGYGKTEVAMRAAFKAVVDGAKQVAVLVPTTVLAMQHYETFSERMRGFSPRIDVVSRFKSAKEIRETLRNACEGKIDILIGTHRLLSDDVHFKDLGLIIIDEEQRFGVRAKEHLKKLKTGVDCLTLSATPIPRTLYMSLVSAKDMSVINTPPQDRLPVKTILAETEPELITNALLRELARSGQAFFIHNRVETIYARADAIQKLVPAARVGVVHGQMDPDDIDTLFHRFRQGEIDLLLATTIVENGIDVPNANTILIDRADTYGLADLYQLRGRVGRWNRAAYAYFLLPKNVRLPELTRKRLNALIEAGSYGGGMKIAMRDLEIRGAGDLLGVQQSGQVSSIGFHLYCKLLKRAVDALKKQKPISFDETKLEAPYDARLPDTYIDELSIRLELYHRIGEVTTNAEIAELFDEIRDRFGKEPPQVIWLRHLTRLRAFASANRFVLLKFGNVSFGAEQQTPKGIEKKTILLPKRAQTPAALEEFVIEALKREFVCEKNV